MPCCIFCELVVVQVACLRQFSPNMSHSEHVSCRCLTCRSLDGNIEDSACFSLGGRDPPISWPGGLSMCFLEVLNSSNKSCNLYFRGKFYIWILYFRFHFTRCRVQQNEVECSGESFYYMFQNSGVCSVGLFQQSHAPFPSAT